MIDSGIAILSVRSPGVPEEGFDGAPEDLLAVNTPVSMRVAKYYAYCEIGKLLVPGADSLDAFAKLVLEVMKPDVNSYASRIRKIIETIRESVLNLIVQNYRIRRVMFQKEGMRRIVSQ